MAAITVKWIRSQYSRPTAPLRDRACRVAVAPQVAREDVRWPSISICAVVAPGCGPRVGVSLAPPGSFDLTVQRYRMEVLGRTFGVWHGAKRQRPACV